MDQRTFGEIVGMDPIVPASKLPGDLIMFDDGIERERCEGFADCRDVYYPTEEECFDSNVAIVEDILTQWIACADEYATENTDYADGYAHIIDENSFAFGENVKEWICDNYPDMSDKMLNSVCDEIAERMSSMDCEAEYSANEYSGYSGKGLCLGSFDIGECEEQISINDIPEFKELHAQGILKDILAKLDHDFCFYKRDIRVKNESTGYYEVVGREYYSEKSDYPDILLYRSPGGRWDFVVDADTVHDMVREAIANYFEDADNSCAPVSLVADRYYARGCNESFDHPVDAMVAFFENDGITSWGDIVDFDYEIGCMNYAEFDNWEDVLDDYVDFDEYSDDWLCYTVWRDLLKREGASPADIDGIEGKIVSTLHGDFTVSDDGKVRAHNA